MIPRVLVILAALTVSAFAADDRKIDFQATINDADGQPVMDCSDLPAPQTLAECKTKHPLTLGTVAMRALVQPEQNMSPEESFKRGQLALQVYKSSSVELKAEDVALIKKQIAKSFGPLITVRAFPLLDPAVK